MRNRKKKVNISIFKITFTTNTIKYEVFLSNPIRFIASCMNCVLTNHISNNIDRKNGHTGKNGIVR